jgi:hypothetical protein
VAVHVIIIGRRWRRDRHGEVLARFLDVANLLVGRGRWDGIGCAGASCPLEITFDRLRECILSSPARFGGSMAWGGIDGLLG